MTDIQSKIENGELENFIVQWNKAINIFDEKRLYILTLKFFRKLIPFLKNTGNTDKNADENMDITSKIVDFSNIIEILNKDLHKLVDLNYEKNMQIKNIMGNFYNNALNYASWQLMGHKSISEPKITHNIPESANSNNESTNETTNETTDISDMEKSIINQLKPKELDHSDFFTNKIRDLFEENIIIWLDLYDYSRALPEELKIKYRKDITEIIIFLLDAFPDSGDTIIKRLILKYDLIKLNNSEFIQIVEKSLDKLPYPIIFALINHIQELILNYSSKSNLPGHDLKQIDTVLEIFLKYANFYPNYFAAHINLYFGLIGKYKNAPNITIVVCKLLEFFAKQGDERINELFFEIYYKIITLEDNLVVPAVKILREALSNGEDYVFSNFYNEGNIANKSIRKIIYDNFSSKSKEIQEISFEIAISLWKYEINTIIENTSKYKSEKSLLQYIFNPIIKIMKRMIKDKIESVYLFSQAVADCDTILMDINKKPKSESLKDIFLKENLINNPDDLFNTIKEFITYLRERQ